MLALLGALVMVGGAVVLRTNVIDSGGSTDGHETLRLRCGTDLEQVCRRLAEQDRSIEVTVADEGATADALAKKGAAPDFDAWLTVGPWAAIVADDRRRAGLDEPVLADPSGVLARSPVTFVGPRERLDALATHCGGVVDWTCIGDASGQQWSAVGGPQTWGAVKAGLAPPETGAGLVAAAQAVATESETVDWQRADLDDHTDWLTGLVDSADRTDDPLRAMLTQPGRFSVAAPLEQRSGPELTRSGRRDTFRLLYPEPVLTADVTLVPATGRNAADLLERLGSDRLATELAADGWRVDGRPGPPGVGATPALPARAQLPVPGALQALRDRWKEITR